MENNIMEIIQVVTYTRPSVDVEFNPPAYIAFYADPEIHTYVQETYADTGKIDLSKSSKGNNDGKGILSEDGLSSTMTICFTSEEARDEFISDSRMFLIDPSINEHRTQNGITIKVTINGVEIAHLTN